MRNLIIVAYCPGYNPWHEHTSMIYSSDSLSSSRRSCATVASAERSSSPSTFRRSSAAAAPGLTVRAYSSEHTVR